MGSSKSIKIYLALEYCVLGYVETCVLVNSVFSCDFLCICIEDIRTEIFYQVSPRCYANFLSNDEIYVDTVFPPVNLLG